MSVHHIERPPEVAAAIHSIGAQFVLWQFCVQAVELGYSDGLSNLGLLVIRAAIKSAGKTSRIRALTPGGQWSRGTVRLERGPQRLGARRSRDSYNRA